MARRGIHARIASTAAIAVGLVVALPAGGAAAKTPRAKPFHTCGDWVRYARAHASDIARPWGIPATPGVAQPPPPAAIGGPAPSPGAGGGQSGGGGGGGGDGTRSGAPAPDPVAGQDFSTTNVQ